MHLHSGVLLFRALRMMLEGKTILWYGNVHAPVQAKQPATTQTIKLIPTLPALRFTNAGELKIPLPICRPTTRLRPLRYVTVFIFSRCACPEGSSADVVRGKSMSLYEKEVIDRRERDERGEGVGEFSTERFECVEGDDASDARSTSSSCVVMTPRERKSSEG